MKLNSIFTSHMVLAKGLPIRIYGEGSGTVQVRFCGYQKTITSHEQKWLVEFPPMEYGGPYSMEVIFEDKTIVLEDIYIGEVILFAGQSNVQFKMEESNTPTEQYQSNCKLRLFSTDRIEKTDYFTASDGWVVCQKEQVAHWSALAYLAGNEISRKKDIAVGVIACYQGASVIESWVPKGTFEDRNIHIPLDKKHPDHVCEAFGQWNGDGVLYTYALSQVVPFSLSAVVWYQGESDTSEEEGRVYSDQLAVLIDVWRKDFYRDNLPFVVVQIADYRDRSDAGWALIQKAQMDIQTKMPYVKTVVSADVCETNDIHPPTKTKLARRISSVLLRDMA